MPSLNAEELEKVESALGEQCKVHSSTVARVYAGAGGEWRYTRVLGAACLVTDSRLHASAIRVVDLASGQVRFDQELYEGFEYKEPAPFFHCFETDDGVAALSFADEAEAADFAKAVRHMAPRAGSGSHAVGVSSPAVPKAAKPARPPPGPKPPRTPPASTTTQHTSPPAQDEQDEREKEKERERAEKEREKAEKEKEKERERAEKEAAAAAKKQQQQQQQQDKPKKKGLFGRLFGGGDDEPDGFAISQPENFRHQAHIGWDPEHGFDIRNIPPEWKKLFQAAGVKKSELNNPETCAVVMQVIQQHADVPGVGEGGSAPPPPPPPPPPPMPGGGAARKPPAATAPSEESGDGSTSQESSSPTGGGSDSRAGLLAQIQEGKKLRKVDPATAQQQIGQEKLPDLDTNEGRDLVGALQAAMANRRGQLKEDEQADDDPDDAVWSD